MRRCFVAGALVRSNSDSTKTTDDRPSIRTTMAAPPAFPAYPDLAEARPKTRLIPDNPRRPPVSMPDARRHAPPSGAGEPA